MKAKWNTLFTVLLVIDEGCGMAKKLVRMLKARVIQRILLNFLSDIMVGWNESHMDDVNRAMYGYRLLEGMDLTFEFYGHLVGVDGEIRGIVSEAAWGRMITAEDFSRVYRAVTKLQRRGLLYKACLTNRFMVANNKVRLLDLAMVDPHHALDPAMLEKEAELWHWSELTRLFHEIGTIGPYGKFRAPLHRFRSTYEDLQCLPLPRSPERPLGGIMLYPNFFANHYIEPWPEYVDIWEKRRPVYGEVTRKSVRGKHNIMSAALISGFSEGDRPLSVETLQNRHPRRITYHFGGKLADSDTNSSEEPTSDLLSSNSDTLSSYAISSNSETLSSNSGTLSSSLDMDTLS